MEELRLILLGFGSANQALVKMMLEKSELHCNRRCLRTSDNHTVMPWKIKAIVTGRHGRVCVPIVETSSNDECYEINAVEALECIESGGMLDDSLIVKVDGSNNEPVQNNTHITTKAPNCQQQTLSEESSTQQTIDLLRLLSKTDTANIVIEAIPSNPRHGGGEPAVSFIRTALEEGLHVVSANKGPLAQQEQNCNSTSFNATNEVYWNLQNLATKTHVQYLHESAVMDGVPIFSLWQHTLPHARLTKIRGCLNSTTTLILTRMESNGETFEEALHKARAMGIVERDESLDLDGYDAAVKLRALLVAFSSSSYLGNPRTAVPPIEDITKDSIRGITPADIKRAFEDDGKKYRLVASAELVDRVEIEATTQWKAQVKLELVTPTDPIYNLTGTSSSVQFYTDVLSPITMVSTDPTLVDTAYGLFTDIVQIASSDSEARKKGVAFDSTA
jgi:homoserine dehydrogenase